VNPTITIDLPEIVEYKDEARIQSLITLPDRSVTLWYSVPRKYRDYLTTEQLDGFVIACLPEAMRRGTELVVNGPMSERLHYNLSNYYCHIRTLLYPHETAIRIRPASLTNKPLECAAKGVAAGFSGGVDSFSIIHDHYTKPTSGSYKLSHLVFTNVGSHGTANPEHSRKVFRARYECLRGYTDRAGIELIPIDSNLSELVQSKYWHATVLRHGSAVMMLQKLFARYIYASTLRYQDSLRDLARTRDSSHLDAISAHLLSTESFETILAGCQQTRIEKTRLVSQVENANKYLNVCIRNLLDGRNCSRCATCRRTMYTLEMLGLLDQFAEVFDLDIWSRIRNRFVSSDLLARSVLPLANEILTYTKESNYPITRWQRFAGWAIRWMPKPVYRIGRSIGWRVFGRVR